MRLCVCVGGGEGYMMRKNGDILYQEIAGIPVDLFPGSTLFYSLPRYRFRYWGCSVLYTKRLTANADVVDLEKTLSSPSKYSGTLANEDNSFRDHIR